MHQALARCEPLQRLQQRLAESSARMEAIRTLLPIGLQRAVLAGPVDDEGWTLLAANAGVAAKLRQLLPRLEQCLQNRGWPQNPKIKIRVQSSHAG
jgi:hypothetical protein